MAFEQCGWLDDTNIEWNFYDIFVHFRWIQISQLVWRLPATFAHCFVKTRWSKRKTVWFCDDAFESTQNMPQWGTTDLNFNMTNTTMKAIYWPHLYPFLHAFLHAFLHVYVIFQPGANPRPRNRHRVALVLHPIKLTTKWKAFESPTKSQPQSAYALFMAGNLFPSRVWRQQWMSCAVLYIWGEKCGDFTSLLWWWNIPCHTEL